MYTIKHFMFRFQNIFDEQEEVIYERFSFVLIAMLFYYAVSYYGIAGLPFSKIHIVICILAGHIVQVCIIRKLWIEQQTMLMWGVIIVPMLLYLFLIKYKRHMQRKKAMSMNNMIYQMQQENQPSLGGLYNQDTSVAGVQNSIIKQTAHPISAPPPQAIPNLHQQRSQNFYTPSANQQMGGQVPMYGDYVSQYNPENASPFSLDSLNPFSNSMSPF